MFDPQIRELLDRIRTTLPAGMRIYLVGGAVRDALLSRKLVDLDFVLLENALQQARRLADLLGGAYYPLDVERATARVILTQADGSRQILDFAAPRGLTLEDDLRARDFTINAMALDLQDSARLIDPLHGAADLLARRLIPCNQDSLRDDPLRVIRAVRLAVSFNLTIAPSVQAQIRQAASGLNGISVERQRDELFRILEGPDPATGMRLLDFLQILSNLLPELYALKGVEQSAPHVADVWSHTLSVISYLGKILTVLAVNSAEEERANLFLGLLALHLGRFRQQIHTHLSRSINTNRSLSGLLNFSALYHDAGKPDTAELRDDGRVRFIGHEQVSARLVVQRGLDWHLSNGEVDRLRSIVNHHMRPHFLAGAPGRPSRRAIYRFYKSTGESGIDICLLALADTLAIYEQTLPVEVWVRRLEVVRDLLSAWWENPAEAVTPVPVVNGEILLRELSLSPGPRIGSLLEAIREGQAAGTIQNQADAFNLARQMVKDNRWGE